MEADFGGYATKANVKCSDGKTISSTAFAHQDKTQVPLVYNHGHNNPENVLGHAILEHRQDGVYAYGFFNNTKQGQDAREYVQHKDIKAMSIYANRLVMKGQTVMHGEIKEVSLVLAGANPGAVIDQVQIQHSDGELEDRDGEVVIMNGFNIDEDSLAHAVEGTAVAKPAAKTVPTASSDSSGDGDGADTEDKNDDESIMDVYDTLTDKQKNVVDYMIGVAASQSSDSAAQHSDEDEEDDEDDADTNPEGDSTLNHQEGTGTVTNVFEQAKKDPAGGAVIKHHELGEKDLRDLYQAAKRSGSVKVALEEYVIAHGLESVDTLFPNAQLLNNTPDFLSRNMAWVQDVLDSTRKSPFSRIRSIVADITQDEARAKGYVTGNMKKEEYFTLVQRTTSPTTVYKKQVMNRDDVLDIIDFDVIAWLKGEMRLMLSEEVATAILLGDGREVDNTDHIADPLGASSGAGVRSIMNDHELYVTRVQINIDDANSTANEIVDGILAASEFYKGTGSPTFYSTQRMINQLLLSRDADLHRNYDNLEMLAAAMGVSKIVAVEPMLRFPNVIGIVVNLTDYNVGTDRGGEVNMFDFFDIDYNKLKYLMETRVSGAMVKPKAAMVITRATAGNVLVTPQTPGWSEDTGVVNIPNQTGVVYKSGSTTGSTLTAGAQTALATGASLLVFAVPASGYFFAVSGTPLVDEWNFKRPAV